MLPVAVVVEAAEVTPELMVDLVAVDLVVVEQEVEMLVVILPQKEIQVLMDLVVLAVPVAAQVKQPKVEMVEMDFPILGYLQIMEYLDLALANGLVAVAVAAMNSTLVTQPEDKVEMVVEAEGAHRRITPLGVLIDLQFPEDSKDVLELLLPEVVVEETIVDKVQEMLDLELLL